MIMTHLLVCVIDLYEGRVQLLGLQSHVCPNVFVSLCIHVVFSLFLSAAKHVVLLHHVFVPVSLYPPSFLAAHNYVGGC